MGRSVAPCKNIRRRRQPLRASGSHMGALGAHAFCRSPVQKDAPPAINARTCGFELPLANGASTNSPHPPPPDAYFFISAIFSARQRADRMLDVRVAHLLLPSLRLPRLPGSLPKNRRPHAHQRRPFLDRHFVVPAHPHRQLRQRHPKLRLHPVAQFPKRHKILPRHLRLGLRRRDAHQPFDVQPPEPQQFLHLLPQFLGAEAKLAALPRHIDLQQHPRMRPHLVRDAVHVLRQLQRIHPVQQLK